MRNLHPASMWCLTLIAALPKPLAIGTLVLVFASGGWAQTNRRYCCEGYAFFGGRTSTPVTSVGGVGGEVFIYKGLAAGAEVGTTINNPDNKITIASAGGAYHFLCCRVNRRAEPFIAGGWSYLAGHINTHGIDYPWDPGQDRNGPNLGAGLVVWPVKRLGVRFEVRQYRMFVSYGALENVIPGGHFVEFRVAFALR